MNYLHDFPRRFFVYILCVVLTVLTLGCGSKVDVAKNPLDFPPTISVDGKEWAIADWSEQDEKRIASYFYKNPALMEHSGLAGQRVRYSDGTGTERYYWVTRVEDQVQWLLLEFNRAKAGELIEGEGQPFLQPAGSV